MKRLLPYEHMPACLPGRPSIKDFLLVVRGNRCPEISHQVFSNLSLHSPNRIMVAYSTPVGCFKTKGSKGFYPSEKVTPVMAILRHCNVGNGNHRDPNISNGIVDFFFTFLHLAVKLFKFVIELAYFHQFQIHHTIHIRNRGVTEANAILYFPTGLTVHGAVGTWRAGRMTALNFAGSE